MTSTAGLLIIIGLFVIFNSKNFVDVFQGKAKINVDTSAPVVNASGQRAVGGSAGR